MTGDLRGIYSISLIVLSITLGRFLSLHHTLGPPSDLHLPACDIYIHTGVYDLSSTVVLVSSTGTGIYLVLVSSTGLHLVLVSSTGI